MKRKQKILIVIVIAAVVIAAAYFTELNACRAAAEDTLVRCWILCKPGSQVTVRRTPSKNAMEVGRLEVGDDFMTDAVSANGFIRVYGIGEYGEGWIYSGYVSTEKPKPVNMNYCCVAKARVACRRWMDGPQTENPWLKNGSSVKVYWMTDEWAVTARGYIKSEWLEADPE